MKKLFFLITFGVVIIVLTGVIIAGSNILTAEEDIEALITVNKSFLERSRLYSHLLELKEQINSKTPDYYRIKKLIEETKEEINNCFACHKNDLTKNKITRIKYKLEHLHNLPPQNINSSLVNDIFYFSKLSYFKAVDLFITHTSSAKSAIESAKITPIVTSFFGFVALVVFTIISFVKIEKLEKNIKEREYTLEQWALTWQDTFDSVSDMIGVLDENLKLISSNESLNKFLKENISLDEIFRFLGITNYSEDLVLEEPKVLEISGKSYSIKFYKRRNGKGNILVIRDITYEVELERKYLQQEKMAAIGIMAAGIAHELRNPLTGIMGYSEILKSCSLEDKAVKMIDRIYTSATRMDKIINDLLVFSRKIKLTKEKTDIHKVLDKAIDNVKEAVNHYDIKIIKRYSYLPSIMVDSSLIEQVITNILINAIQAIEESNVGDSITVETRKDSQKVIIEITDNGPGMDENIISRIFEPFFTTKDPGRGTGLGLSICYSFIKAHGGDIHVKSALGKGSTFTIELPIKTVTRIIHEPSSEG